MTWTAKTPQTTFVRDWQTAEILLLYAHLLLLPRSSFSQPQDSHQLLQLLKFKLSVQIGNKVGRYSSLPSSVATVRSLASHPHSFPSPFLALRPPDCLGEDDVTPVHAHGSHAFWHRVLCVLKMFTELHMHSSVFFQQRIVSRGKFVLLQKRHCISLLRYRAACRSAATFFYFRFQFHFESDKCIPGASTL